MRTAIFALALVACGPGTRQPNSGDDGGPTIDAPTGSYIKVAPENATLTIIDGVAESQAYTATLVDVNGMQTDVTSDAVFTVASDAIGAWAGPTLTAGGAASGLAHISATADGATGSTGLTVIVKNSRNEGGAPANAATLFGNATEVPGLAPTIVYPADGILAPPNLGAFDVHWTTTQTNLFAVDLSNAYVDITIYTTGLTGNQWWTVLTPAEWATVASSQLPLSLTVAGISTGNPNAKGTSPAQHVGVTNEKMVGGLYYWTTSSPQGVFRYDMSQPNTPPAPYFMASQNPGGPSNCMGCHALSHDGTKFALTIDSAGGRGTVINVADGAVLVPYLTNPQYWDFATFNADGSKLVTANTQGGTGTLSLRSTNGGAVLGAIPNTPGKYATHPELSADGTMFANVEVSGYDDDIEPETGAIVVRTFDDGTNTFGPIQTVVADGVDGLSSYYPSWSPDRQWLLITRVSGVAYANAASTVWVVKADGTMPPIKLGSADLTGALEDSWARWAPFAQTTGNGDQVFYFTFSSLRQFGVRIPQIGTPQIWMAPFYPALAAAGQDPSGPAFRPPFQDVGTHNHIAQWTEQVVVIQ